VSQRLEDIAAVGAVFAIPIGAAALSLLLKPTEAMATKARLKVSLSESMSFNISPYTYVSGIIQAIRVQDIPRDIWYEWDRPGPWKPSAPIVTVGSKTLYIAFWAVNNGNTTGTLTLTVKDDTGKTLASKSVSCAPGAGVGIEAPDLDMPNRTYGITLSVTP
jgi:hypothetical protein